MTHDLRFTGPITFNHAAPIGPLVIRLNIEDLIKPNAAGIPVNGRNPKCNLDDSKGTPPLVLGHCNCVSGGPSSAGSHGHRRLVCVHLVDHVINSNPRLGSAYFSNGNCRVSGPLACVARERQTYPFPPLGCLP